MHVTYLCTMRKIPQNVFRTVEFVAVTQSHHGLGQWVILTY